MPWITVCPSRFSDLPTALNERGAQERKATTLKNEKHLLWVNIYVVDLYVGNTRYSSNEIRKTQDEHLNIVCQNLNHL